MRIQNHSSGSKRHSGSLIVTVDSVHEPKMALELLKQAAMTCPSILEFPDPSVAATAFQGDRITYEIHFNTSTFASAGDARTELIAQLYKRASRASADFNTFRNCLGGRRSAAAEFRELG
jgi:small-conductance mechanosensitive channel